MARFRAPSTVEDSVSDLARDDLRKASSSGKPTPEPTSTKRRRKRKTRRADMEKITNQAKTAAIKDKVHKKRINGRRWCHVFVGNLAPNVTEAQLVDAFSHCGTVLRVIIRVSRGTAVSAYFNPSTTDRCYATVDFKRSSAVLQALELNGKSLCDLPMVVCLSAADLPEVNEIMSRRKRNTTSTKNDARRLAEVRTLIIDASPAKAVPEVKAQPVFPVKIK